MVLPNPYYRRPIPDTLNDRINAVLTDPPFSNFPEAVVYFGTATGQLILVDMTTPIYDAVVRDMTDALWCDKCVTFTCNSCGARRRYAGRNRTKAFDAENFRCPSCSSHDFIVRPVLHEILSYHEE